MLTLPIKKKWFNMIFFCIKKEEYREIKPYYTTRFQNAGLLDYSENPCPTAKRVQLAFRNGYQKNAPMIVAECSLLIKEGNVAWGAVKGETYYALQIERLIKRPILL